MSTSSPPAPGRLGVAATAAELLDYLGRLDAWLAERRAELDTLDAQILATGRQAELTGDMSLAMALWQAARTRQSQLLAAWDSGRVGQQELDKLSTLIWGRLDAAGGTLPAAGVSLPEAGRLCDALVAQLRARLNTDPNATAYQIRLRDLRAQAERIRDQLALEPATTAPAGQAKLAAILARTSDLGERLGRGGDIGGLIGPLEVEAATFERDLIVGSAKRRQAQELVGEARSKVAEVGARSVSVHALRSRVVAAVWPEPAVQVPDPATLGRMPNTAAALTGYLAALSRMDADLTTAQNQLSRALSERDAAASLAQALAAKAVSLGHVDDPELVQIGAAVTKALAGVPVAVPVVQQLLAAYTAQLDYLGREQQ